MSTQSVLKRMMNIEDDAIITDWVPTGEEGDTPSWGVEKILLFIFVLHVINTVLFD